MKFYEEMLIALATFFGMADATESELHQTLSEAGTLEEIKTNALAEANEKVSAAMADLKTSMEELKNSFATEKAESGEKLTALQTSFDELKQAAIEKDAKITEQADQITALSGELASAKVKLGGTGADAPPDGGVPVANAEKTTGKQVMTNKTFMGMFGA